MQCCISSSLVCLTYVSDTVDLYINQGKFILFLLNKILSGPISPVIVDKVKENKKIDKTKHFGGLNLSQRL